MYRRCRAAGETVRRLTDSLIAVVAMRHRVPVLHRDADFAVIERHAELAVDEGD
jgi:predicted nucleic acid-binding protein